MMCCCHFPRLFTLVHVVPVAFRPQYSWLHSEFGGFYGICTGLCYPCLSQYFTPTPSTIINTPVPSPPVSVVLNRLLRTVLVLVLELGTRVGNQASSPYFPLKCKVHFSQHHITISSFSHNVTGQVTRIQCPHPIPEHGFFWCNGYG